MRCPIMAPAVTLSLALLPCLALAKPAVWFAPANDFYRYDVLHSKDANMSEAEFNQITDEITALYAPLAALHGATLTVEKNWSDPTVNAYADQNGDVWSIHMFGGLARRPETTADGYALVVCHELGHHFGGYPFYGPSDWAASEGQSDYFATLACARKIWGHKEAENEALRAQASLEVRLLCDAAHDERGARNLCYRAMRAGQSLANLLATLGQSAEPRLSTPDPRVIEDTDPTHPDAQCRLDTYAAGALCASSFNDQEIPARNHSQGQDSVVAERQANTSACSQAARQAIGTRPRCWFAPLERLAAIADATEVAELQGNNNGIPEPGELIEVRIPLANRFSFAVGGAIAKVASEFDPMVAVWRNESEYPQMPAEQTTLPSQGFVFQLQPGAACGSEIRSAFDLTSPLGHDRGWLGFRIGRLAVLGDYLGGSNISIPDNDAAGIEDAIVVDSSSLHAQYATVKVRIDHSFVGDLTIDLRAPDGTIHHLKYLGDGGNDSQLDATYEVNLQDSAASGAWTLLVKDLAPVDEGVLSSWSLQLKHAVCEQASR